MSDELAKEIEALARKCADALEFAWVVPDGIDQSQGWVKEVIRNRDEMRQIRIDVLLPILRPHIERHERLREAAKRVCFAHELKPSMDNRELENKHIRLTHADSIAALRTALDEETKG